MNQVAILYPVFVQVLLTFVVYGLLAVARSRAIAAMDRQRGNADLALGRVRVAARTPTSAPPTTATSSSCRCCSMPWWRLR